jgi:hypothetical protein
MCNYFFLKLRITSNKNGVTYDSGCKARNECIKMFQNDPVDNFITSECCDSNLCNSFKNQATKLFTDKISMFIFYFAVVSSYW